MTDDLQPEQAVSEWSSTLIGFEPCTGDYHASEWGGLERAYADAIAAGHAPVLVKTDSGRFALWVPSNPFFSEMSDIENAKTLRDHASRRLTGKEHALCCFIANGLHLNSAGEWKSKRDLKAFQSLCANENLQVFLNPPTQPSA